MDKKEQIAELLSNLSEEDLANLTSLLQDKPTKKATKKKTTKKRTPRKKATKKVNTADFMHGIHLDPQERAELKSASKFDKDKGLDKPKEAGIIPKSPGFQKVEARCMICGKSFKVAPSLIPPERDRFKCNMCCSTRGSH
jgi:hypothetical protein